MRDDEKKKKKNDEKKLFHRLKTIEKKGEENVVVFDADAGACSLVIFVVAWFRFYFIGTSHFIRIISKFNPFLSDLSYEWVVPFFSFIFFCMFNNCSSLQGKKGNNNKKTIHKFSNDSQPEWRYLSQFLCSHSYSYFMTQLPFGIHFYTCMFIAFQTDTFADVLFPWLL